MLDLIQKAEQYNSLTRDEIVSLLKDNSCNDKLFAAADRVRAKYVGDEVHLRGLIEFSNICKQNCLYCGLRRDNSNIERYRLSEQEIVDFAQKAVSYGYKTIVMQSGEDPYFTIERLVSILKKVKKFDVAVTLSIGERTKEEYKTLKEAGVDRFLLRIETTDRDLYEKMDPGMSHQNRIECLKNLKELGFETGSGCLVGLPEQSVESLADDILFFKEIDADMVGIGPFIPNADTPLKDNSLGDFVLSLKVMALTRLLLKDVNIPATTAMETIDPMGRVKALCSGANVVMPNVTEGDYRRKYAIYPGKICINDTPVHCRGCISSKIQSIGRKVSQNYGFRPKIDSCEFNEKKGD